MGLYDDILVNKPNIIIIYIYIYIYIYYSILHGLRMP